MGMKEAFGKMLTFLEVTTDVLTHLCTFDFATYFNPNCLLVYYAHVDGEKTSFSLHTKLKLCARKSIHFAERVMNENKGFLSAKANKTQKYRIPDIQRSHQMESYELL